MIDTADTGTQNMRYRFSGKLGRSFVLLPLLSMSSIVVVSYISAELSLLIPYMKAKVAIAVVFGMGTGWVIAWLAQRLLCRSPFYVSFVALMTAVLGVHAAIAAFDSAVLNKAGLVVPSATFSNLLFDPAGAWDLLVQINQGGFFTKRGRVMSGTDLWVDWGFEIAPYFLAIPITAWAVFKKKIFCEDCVRWLALEKKNIQFPVPADDKELTRMQAGDLSVLADKTPLKQQYVQCVRLDYVVCPSCGNTGTYRIVKVEDAEQEKSLSPLMLLTPENVPVLGTILAKSETGPDAPRDANPAGSAG